ncbi:glycosyltransferase [Clostridium sp. AF19-22AC]|jgi:glycosyltransferase involved in cell wall biosynthesis|uniref:glycosyltransferase n=1 Tax=Clostridia TaxID=186801 RepID=UPI000E51F3DD|nr:MULTISPECIES: glycosyltransferase [Clostridia]RHR28693.1 glycosyltransferase [Clostridium sp. AF19-22AC]
MKPGISVIVPIYNVEHYLKRCMTSLINQTLNNIEIIMVDDGSPDSCPQMCDEYEKNYSNIKVIHKANAGLGMARNSGIEIATGEYIAFVDSDDYVDCAMYEELLKVAKKNNADYVGCDFAFCSESGKETMVNAYKKEFVYYGSETKKVFVDMLGAPAEYHSDVVNQMSACKGIYRKSLIVDCNIRFPSEKRLIAEDLIFHLDFFENTKCVCYIPKAFYFYCINWQSVTHTYATDRYLREIALYEYLCGTISEYPGSMNRVQRTFLGRIRVCLKDSFKSKSAEACNTRMAIINNEVVQNVAKEYDISNMYFPYRLFIIFLRRKNKFALRLFFGLLSLKGIRSLV